eukprot:1152538-Pelagomonas_calceolata.AAC.9
MPQRTARNQISKETLHFWLSIATALTRNAGFEAFNLCTHMVDLRALTTHKSKLVMAAYRIVAPTPSHLVLGGTQADDRMTRSADPKMHWSRRIEIWTRFKKNPTWTQMECNIN